jgi:hypothetical protein
MLLLPSDWSHYHRCLNVHLAELRIHPSRLASSRVPSSHLYTDVLCLLYNPRGFEAPPLGTPIAALTRCWLNICQYITSTLDPDWLTNDTSYTIMGNSP